MIGMTVSNKWAKLLTPIIWTSEVKYIVATRCNMATEQKYDDKSYATMKFVKTIVKKYMQVCDDETAQIDCENPNLSDEMVMNRVIRESSDKISWSTF